MPKGLKDRAKSTEKAPAKQSAEKPAPKKQKKPKGWWYCRVVSRALDVGLRDAPKDFTADEKLAFLNAMLFEMKAMVGRDDFEQPFVDRARDAAITRVKATRGMDAK